MKPISVIMDCDPGHDDAIGLVLAAVSEELRVLAVTTCSGNQTLEKTTRNARQVCKLVGLDVPVASGAAKPLFSEKLNAQNIHGDTGLDGAVLPEPTRRLSELSAVALMAQTLRAAAEPVTIISTGPMTNTACLLLAHPELKPKIAQISFMGGGIAHGNWTPAAEFNILADPEAADVVLRSGVPLVMAGLDVTEQALAYPEDFARIRALGSTVSGIVADWLEFFYGFHKKLGYPGAPLHDPVATAVLLAPELFTVRPLHVQVELCGKYCRGATVGDERETPNVRCIMGVDRVGFLTLLTDRIARYGGSI